MRWWGPISYVSCSYVWFVLICDLFLFVSSSFLWVEMVLFVSWSYLWVGLICELVLFVLKVILVRWGTLTWETCSHFCVIFLCDDFNISRIIIWWNKTTLPVFIERWSFQWKRLCWRFVWIRDATYNRVLAAVLFASFPYLLLVLGGKTERTS